MGSNLRFRSLAALTLTWASAQADDGVLSRRGLNHSKAHEAFLESEWKPLAAALESFLADPDRQADRVDSAFAYRYLGVIYATVPETRPRGEARFRRLLALDPAVDSADIKNLYASPEVMELFLRLREEYPRSAKGRRIVTAHAAAGGSGSAPAEAGKEMSAAGRKRWLWVGAAGAAVAAGIGAFLYVSHSDASGEIDTKVQVEL